MIAPAREEDHTFIRFLSVLRNHTISFPDAGRNTQPFSPLTQFFRVLATEACVLHAGPEHGSEAGFLVEGRKVYFLRQDGHEFLSVVSQDGPGKLYVTELA